MDFDMDSKKLDQAPYSRPRLACAKLVLPSRLEPEV